MTSIKPNFLFVLPSLHCGGAELHTVHQINYIFNTGHQVHLCILGKPEGIESMLQIKKENIIYLNWDYIYIKTASVFGFFSVARHLQHVLQANHITHVFAHLPLSHYLMRWVKLLHCVSLSKPFTLITYHHSLVYEHSPTNTVGKYLFNKFNSAMAYCFDDKTICVSEAVKQNISSRFYLRQPHVLYNALPYEPQTDKLAQQYCKQQGIALPHYLILFPGSLKPVKGHLLFVDAFEKLVATTGCTPEQVKVVLAGSGDAETQIKQHIAAKGLTDFFVFTGSLSNHLLLSFMQLSRLVVIPSLSEGMPMVAIEALMQGKTILCSDAGGLPEIITTGVTGFLFPKGNHNALAQKLIYLYQNQVTLNSADLVNYYRQHFSFPSHIQQLLAIALGKKQQ